MNCSNYLPIYLSIYLPIYLSIYLSLHLSIYLVYLPTSLCIHLFTYLSIYLSTIHFSKIERQKVVRTCGFFPFWLGNVLRATAGCYFSKIEHQKVVRTCGFYISHFDLEICFAPQRGAIFQTSNFQMWSETVSFWAFWLGNVLRATAGCNFWNFQLPKVFWSPPLFF